MCIMEYDALQYCDFLGSICSIWVTILCMARIRDTFKYVSCWLLPLFLIYFHHTLSATGWLITSYGLCVCVDSVYVRDSSDSHVNAAGPQRSLEPTWTRPLCHTDHGHYLGKSHATILQRVWTTSEGWWNSVQSHFAEVCWIHICFVDRCTEGCGGDIVTRLLGNAGCSTWFPAHSAPWSGYACTFLPRRRATTTTHTHCGTSWWPPALCSCCRPKRRKGRRRAGAGAGAGAGTGAGAGDHGFVGTRSVRAARTNSTLLHRRAGERKATRHWLLHNTTIIHVR